MRTPQPVQKDYPQYTKPMSKPDPVGEYCRREREFLQQRLKDIEAGRLKFGTSEDGYSWTDTTANEITRARAQIAALTQILELPPEK